MSKHTFSQQIKNKDASSYNPLADTFEHFSQIVTSPIASELLQLAKLSDGDKLLDVGTGTGVVSHQAIKLVGNRGSVTGIDFSTGMLKTAKKHHGFNASPCFAQMDAEALAFDNELFDVITSLYVLRHLPNPAIALSEMYRVMRTGGRLVLGVGSGVPWCSPGFIPVVFRQFRNKIDTSRGRYASACHLIDELIVEKLPSHVDSSGSEQGYCTEHTFSNSTLLKWLKNHGFVEIRTCWKGDQFRFDSAQDFWFLQATFSSFARKRLLTAPQDQQLAVKEAFISICENILKKGGRLEYPAGCLLVSAVKA